MRSLRKTLTSLSPAVILASVLCGTISGQSALTTIQDTLFDADGARYNGTLTIQWSTFDATNPGTVIQQSQTVQVVNGNLQIQLAANSTATPPANVYTVLYQSDGDQQYTETWTVPVSAALLKVSQVRTGTGSPAAETVPGSSGPVTESAVTNLVSDLNARPIKGPGFGTNAVAVVDQNGQIETAVGNLGDCVFVDGTTGPCPAPPTFVDFETPGGVVNGINANFTLANSPSGSSLQLYRNGILMTAGLDYSENGPMVQFFNGAIPQPLDTLTAAYRLDPVQGASSEGIAGTNGSPGPAGAAGATGAAGSYGGAITFDFIFDSGTSNADPGGGKLRFSAATQNTAGAAYFDLVDYNGNTVTSVFDTLDASTSAMKGALRFQNKTDVTKWISFDLTSRTTHTGYREFAITETASSAGNPFSAGDELLVEFSRTGDAGSAGASGAAGANGATGSAGAAGAAGTGTGAFGFAFGDPQGAPLTAGSVGYFTVPRACTIAAWNIAVDSGTATFDIWITGTGTAIPTVAGSITASALPAISAGTSIHSTVMTGWTTSVAANSVVGIDLNAAAAKYASLVVECD